MDEEQEQQQLSLHLLELQNETLRSENAKLTREIVELRNMYSELKQSLDEALRTSRPQTTEQVLDPANSEPTQDTVNSDEVSEQQCVSERLAEDGCSSRY